MLEKTIYIANDGTEFEDEDKCRKYEENQLTANYEWQWFDCDGDPIEDKNSIIIDEVHAAIFTTGKEMETFINWSTYNTPEWKGPGLYFYDQRHDEWRYWPEEVQDLLDFGATFGCAYPVN